jgi:methyl-accepting chemotaxis protein
MKKEALAQIARMRYGKKYFWINDMHPNMVMHPIKPALNGKDLSGYQDKRGTYLFKEMVKVCAAKGEGFVKYWWGKPGKQGEFPKLSFVKLFRPWGWVIGTGAYTDDIESSVNKTRAEFTTRMRSLSIWVGAIAVVLAVAMIALCLTLIRKRVNRPLYVLMDFATQIASGNLTARPEGSFAGEFAVLKDAIVSMVDNLEAKIEEAEDLSRQSKEEARKAQEAMIHAEEARKHAEAREAAMIEAASRLEKVVENLISSSEQLSAQSEQALKGAKIQKQRTEETATAMEEMNATVLEVARNASSAAEETEEARSRAEGGADVVSEAAKAIEMINELTDKLKTNMGSLKEKAGGISQVMTVISDIADQTNLLALNAAIEAARAGEAGRGFAVVADEVRKLAEKTMAATREVGQAISEIQSEVEKNVGEMNKVAGSVQKGTELAGESHKSLQEIVDLVVNVADQISAIAEAAREQSSASNEISSSIVDIKDAAEDAASGIEETRDAVEALERLAEELRGMIEELVKD